MAGRNDHRTGMGIAHDRRRLSSNQYGRDPGADHNPAMTCLISYSYR